MHSGIYRTLVETNVTLEENRISEFLHIETCGGGLEQKVCQMR